MKHSLLFGPALYECHLVWLLQLPLIPSQQNVYFHPGAIDLDTMGSSKVLMGNLGRQSGLLRSALHEMCLH